MQRLLLWSLRFVEDFAEDIIAVRDDYVRLAARTFAARCLTPAPDVPPERFQLQVAALLAELADAGLALPGKLTADGVVLDRQHLGRLLNCPTHWLTRRHIARMIDDSNLPIVAGAVLGGPVRGQIEGRPWLDRPIGFFEVEALTQNLVTAAFVTISYLSGARPGRC